MIYTMMGFYPITPADPVYTLFASQFDKVTLHTGQGDLKDLVIKSEIPEGQALQYILIDGEKYENAFIPHDKLINASEIIMH